MEFYSGHFIFKTRKSGKPPDLFVKSYKQNEVPPFGVLGETAGGTNPYFVTGAGGMLQAVLAGFAGLSITDQGVLQVKPTLPKKWKALHIRAWELIKKILA